MKNKIIGLSFLIFSIVFLIQCFLFSSYPVSGNSMENTIKNNDCVLIYDKKPERYDIVIINNTKDNNKLLIKRVIGIGGDTLKFMNISYNNKTKIYIQCTNKYGYTFFIKDDYIKDDMLDSLVPLNQNIKIKENQFYCLGDNRNNSNDSRNYGAFDITNIIGVVILNTHNKIVKFIFIYIKAIFIFAFLILLYFSCHFLIIKKIRLY